MSLSISIRHKYFYLLLIICLHTFNWFQVLLCNSNNVTSVIYLHTVKWIHIYDLHYLHFSDYCTHLCRYVYHNISAVVCSGFLHVVWKSNLAIYFAHQGRLFKFYEPCLMDVSYQLSPVNFPSECSPLPSPGIELTLFRVCHWIAVNDQIYRSIYE